MKSLTRLLSALLLLSATATGYSVNYPFSISFDFETGTTPTVSDPAAVLDSVSDLTGGVLGTGSVNADTPATFSFDVEVDPEYLASILTAGYQIVYNRPTNQLVDSQSENAQVVFKRDGLNIGGGLFLSPGVRTSIAFIPSVVKIGGGTFSIEATGGEGQISLESLTLSGEATKRDPSIASVSDSNTVFLGLVALLGLVAIRATSRRK